MGNKHSKYSEDRFDHDLVLDNLINEKESKSIPKQSTLLADICEICNRYTNNIYTHIREYHPLVYRKMTFRE